MTSLLGRWYYVLSTAFNKILLSKSHVFPELIVGFFHSEWSTQRLVSLLVGQGGHEKITTAAKGQPSVGLWPTEAGGTRGIFWPLPPHKSFTQQRSVGWKKMSPWASSRSHQVGYCVGRERDLCAKGSATRLKCHQPCGSTSLQPALLRDHCGQ